jgi:hypothetical protein
MNMEYLKELHGTMGLPSPLDEDIFKMQQSIQAPLGLDKNIKYNGNTRTENNKCTKYTA